MVKDRNLSKHDWNCWLGGKGSTQTNKTNYLNQSIPWLAVANTERHTPEPPLSLLKW